MRSISDLLVDVRMHCAGCPDMLALYALTQSLGDFLNRSEAWKEWASNNVNYSDSNASSGTLAWPNETNDRTTIMKRVKRIASLRWNADGYEIPFQTAVQLQGRDPLWRTRTSTRPQYFTTEGELPQSGSSPNILVSAHQVRVYPYAETNTVAGTLGARLVLVTNTVANMSFNDWDDDIPSIPDRIYYAFKDVIVCGALMHLMMMPGKDWTSVSLSQVHKANFEAGIIRAASAADMDYGRAPVVCGYGGL